MDRFPLAACRFGDDPQVVVACVGNADIRKRRRQPHRLAEVVDLADDLARPIRQEEPGEHADRHFLAMEVVVGGGEPRQAVVDRMGRRQPGALEAQPAQQRVRLHDVGQAGVTTFCSQAMRAATPYSRIVS